MSETKSVETRPALRIPVVGDDVHLVTARGKHLPAKVMAVGRGGKIDLVSDDLVITNSPRDDMGRLSDSWHFAD